MIEILRTDSDNPGFRKLVHLLDIYLAGINGEKNDFYSSYNGIDMLRHVVLILDDNQPVACGAMKQIDPGVVEIKRMFTLPSNRGKGLGGEVLQELEAWAKELGYTQCVLETGRFMPDAVGLY